VVVGDEKRANYTIEIQLGQSSAVGVAVATVIGRQTAVPQAQAEVNLQGGVHTAEGCMT